MASHVKRKDKVIGNYRSHALSLALTDNPQKITDELFAKKTGEFGGRAGSMHLGCHDKGMTWTSAIVASGIPIAVGIAEAQQRLNQEDGGNRIVICQFGDGAMEEGVFIESINYASLKSLPILFACEDNGLAIHSSKEARTPSSSYKTRVQSWNMNTDESTYEDPIKLVGKVQDSIKQVRLGEPLFHIVRCYRWYEHVGVATDWHLGYRDESELNYWKKFDIESNPNLWGVSDEFVLRESKDAEDKVQKLFSSALKEKDCDLTNLTQFVY
ncbi:Acetoin dehydrogenase E1 component alpha-subunit [Prochlorococcus sp. MIT 0602]|nr:Acetoin dehydrogenase E1 component alpha-subunit [Prochlorococcus sp. MIT 0603]KGG17915.1 Acetoin dehydrogenase E1 component alpha-subunit [Prochlorococcus sp. MIT 0602]